VKKGEVPSPVGTALNQIYNGIRITPNGKYIIFADTNDGKLYRMVPAEVPTERKISEIGVRGRTTATG
jgi:sugar lactone lactonase YvrE